MSKVIRGKGMFRIIKILYSAASYNFRATTWEIFGKFHKFTNVKTKDGIFTVHCSDKMIGKGLFCFKECEYEIDVKSR
jgi:hypothetical protein